MDHIIENKIFLLINLFIILLLISFEDKMSSKNTVNVSNTTNESIDEAVVYLLEIIENLIDKENKAFVTIGLTGGSLIKLLSNGVIKHKERFLNYSSKLKFIFGDERFVPFTSEDSTYKAYVENNFFENLNIPNENVYAIKADAENVEKCAEDYENRIKPLLNSNNGFDILILGHGPDGHICSLFPNHRLFTDRQTKIVVPIDDSPKPPPERVTLTLDVVNQSSFILFCSYGESKATIIKQIVLDKDETLPAAAVKPINSVRWFIDKGAARLLN